MPARGASSSQDLGTKDNDQKATSSKSSKSLQKSSSSLSSQEVATKSSTKSLPLEKSTTKETVNSSNSAEPEPSIDSARSTAPLIAGSGDRADEQDLAIDAAIGVANAFLDCELKGKLSLEADSVYGSAIALPQVARSARWNSTYTALAIRVYSLLFLNIVIQFSLLLFIGQASQVMDVLGGKMHLCDFGATLDKCPNAPTCTGPGGTEYTHTGLYDFDQWSVRSFFRDSYRALKPDKEDAIREQLVPNVGEYGMESWSCRLVCIFIFCMSVVTEIYDCIGVTTLICSLPTDDSPWIRYVPFSEVSGNKAEGFLPASLLGYQMGGIPLIWKIINVSCVLVPKCFLCLAVMWEGFRFLMETAGTVNLVLGSMAMGFILSIDEMALSCLGTPAVLHIMNNLKDKPLFDDVTPEEDDWDDDAKVIGKVKEANTADGKRAVIKAIYIAIPKRLVMLAFLYSVFMWKYYHLNCHNSGAGYVSVPTYLPKSTRYTFSDYVFGELLMVKDMHTPNVAWSMPEPENDGHDEEEEEREEQNEEEEEEKEEKEEDDEEASEPPEDTGL